MSEWKQIHPRALEENTFDLIGRQWMLITAKKDDKVNTMTASWGGLGVIWGENVAYIFVRQSRYTKEFIDTAVNFTLTVFPKEYKKALSYLGTVSGRDEDKIAKAGLTVTYDEKDTEKQNPFFEEAGTALICKKLARYYLGPEGMLDETVVPKWYSGEDENNFHDMYVAKIEKVLVKGEEE